MSQRLFFYFRNTAGLDENVVRPFKEMSEKEKLAFLFPNDAERKAFAKQKLRLVQYVNRRTKKRECRQFQREPCFTL